MAAVKDCYTLISYFQKKYKERYGFPPQNLNKFAARWGFDAVLEGMGIDDAKSLIDYYFLTVSPNRHSLDWFFWNSHKLMEARNEHALDSEQRAVLREQSKQRAAEWRKRLDDKRSTGN